MLTLSVVMLGGPRELMGSMSLRYSALSVELLWLGVRRLLTISYLKPKQWVAESFSADLWRQAGVPSGWVLTAG